MKSQSPQTVASRLQPRKPDDYDNEVEGCDCEEDDEMSGRVIPQAKLRAYYRLLRLIKKKSAMRLELLQELEGGAQIEPGKFQIRCEVHEFQNLTWDRIREYFGDSLVQELRDVIPTTARTHLVVRPKNTVH